MVRVSCKYTYARVPSIVITLLLAMGGATFAADLSAPHVRNFDRVNDHLFRSGEPSVEGLAELGAMGVKTVIDLRESGAATQFEKEQVEKLHMKYINVPFAQLSAPKQAQMEQVLSLLLNDSGPILVHCRRGKDRTGTVIACYRIQHDGWNNERALQEAKEHGLSFAERGMRSYILHFSSLSLPVAHPSVALSKP